MLLIQQPSMQWVDPVKNSAIFRGKMYFGLPRTDPKVLANRVQVYYFDTLGNPQPLPQPVNLSDSGVPTYLGNPVEIYANETCSIRVDDRNGVEKYLVDEYPLRSSEVVGVDSIKSLPSADFATGQYSVTGFYAGSTIGGGVFVWDATRDKADHNGGTVIAPEAVVAWDGTQADLATLLDWTGSGSGSGCYVRDSSNESHVDVTVFGAIGDYLTADDSAAIQAAINLIQTNPSYNLDHFKEGYGGTVFFPPGRFMASGLTITKFNIEFRGVAGASFLVSKSLTGRLLTAQWDGGSNTIGGIKFTDIEVRNVVDRADGAGEIILLDKPVRSHFSNFTMTSSGFNPGSKVSKVGDAIKIIAPFEVTGDVRIYGFIGIGMDIISGPQSDSLELSGAFLYNTVGLVGFRGAGGSGNNNFLFTGKFLGTQGGTYVSGGNDSYAETTVISTSGNDLTVTSATNMKVGRAVVVGRTNTVEIAIIKSIAGNVLTLDRPITLGAGEVVLSGRFGCITSEMRNPAFNGVQFEGCDVGLYTLQGTTKASVSNYSISSCAKPFIINGQIRKLTIDDGVAATSGTLANSVTWKLLTLLNIVDRFSYIYIKDNPAEGSGYYTGATDSLIDNRSGFLPYLVNDTRLEGTIFNAKNGTTAVTFEDNTYLTFKRSATNKFTRLSWKDGASDKWFNDFTRVNGDLEWRLNGEAVASISLSGSSGVPILGDGIWDSIPTRVGTQYLWQDANGKMRTKVGAPSDDIQGDVVAGYESEWDSQSKFRIGSYRLWVDSTGDLRIKSGEPTSDTDGVVVGNQT